MAKKKAKKRGVKPGTKRGPYRKARKRVTKLDIIQQALEEAGNPAFIPKSYTPAPMTLCGQLEDAILLLEQRISNAIAKINSLMG